MLIIQSYATAVILLIITMLCWGSWANTQKLATQKWPFQLFYWDYTLGIVLLSLIFGLTIGSSGELGRSFWEDLQQAESAALRSAFIGGVVFNIANLLLVAAIDIAGMAVAFPVGIGLALVLGVIINYVAVPVGNPWMLFGGVLLVMIAIVLDALAYRQKEQGKAVSNKGLWLSIIAGVLMGFFFRFVAASVATDFEYPQAGLMTPYTAVFVFSVGIFLSNFIWNTIFMYRPLKGERVTFSDYFSKGNVRLHLIGILGGVIWCIGMSFSMLASEQAGFAISYGLGQGATMVAAAWGVFVWREFAEAPSKTQQLIYAMFAFFVVGLALVIAARVV
ncbi:MAG: multidrug DMT transporter permease [Tunicatimonas sp.]|uniref:multidrug DMT transporter permease n=1 Tax=Tunicatimonas sp. TaxID=1940096 RepID=UPI003C725F04